MTGRGVAAALAAAVVTVAVPAARGRAHGPAPAVLEVLADPAETPGLLLRTSVGLARPEETGAYAYGCPSQWGANERAGGAASPDGAAVVMVAGGSGFLSTDGGCTFVPVADPDGGRIDAVRWAPLRGRFVLLVRGPGDDVARLALLDPGGSGRPETAAILDADAALVPDDLAETGDGALLATGARPTPWIWRSPRPGSPTPGRVEELDLGRAGLVAREVTRVDAALASGRHPAGPGSAFLRLTIGAGDETVVATVRLDDSDPKDAGDDHLLPLALELRRDGVLRGPVPWLDADGRRGALLLDGGGRVHRREAPTGDGGPRWTATGIDGWRCLTQAGERVFGCTFDTALVELIDPTDAGATSPAFTFSQLGGPSPSCPPSDPAADFDPALLCALDWQHHGGEAGWLGTAPATDPGAPRTAPPAPSAPGDEAPPPPSSEASGCRIGPATSSASPVAAMAGILGLRLVGRLRTVAARRRRGPHRGGRRRSGSR